MRESKKALFVTLILLSLILQTFLATGFPSGYSVSLAENEHLWCNNFDLTYNEWIENDVSPYLHDTDDNVKTKRIGSTEGNFGFSNSSNSNTINIVTLYMEGLGDGDDYVEVYVSDGSSFTNEGTLIFDTVYSYKTIDLSTKLDSWIKINSAEIYIIYRQGGSKNNFLEIRRAYLDIDYDSGPTPSPGGNPEGDYIESWDTSVQSDYPVAITTDGSYIWIVDYDTDEVYKYSMAGVYTDDHWDIFTQSDSADGIATDGTNIWILDYYEYEVYKYTMAGVYVSTFDIYSETNNPSGITTDGSYIWILDYGDDEVYKYSMAGVYTDDHWDISGQSNTAYGITTDGSYIWIVDFGDDEVYKYNMAGDYTTTHWDISTESNNAEGIATDGINIWVLDIADKEVYKYEITPPPEPPSDPDLLFGAGFNASSPYIELHWNHSLVDVQFFEVQNSSDAESWTYLGQSTTTNYTDTQVFNGTERYYKVRACNQTNSIWYNSSFTDVNFETVYFIEAGDVVAGDTIIMGSAGIFWIILIIIVPIVAYMVKKR